MNLTIFRFFIPVVFYANEGGWVRQYTIIVESYYCLDDDHIFLRQSCSDGPTHPQMNLTVKLCCCMMDS